MLKGKKAQHKREHPAKIRYKTQFSSFKSLDRLGHRGNMREDSAAVLSLFLQEALVSSAGMVSNVHSLTLSI